MDIPHVLPAGIVSPDQWSTTTDWARVLDFEKIRDEAASLPDSAAGRQVLRTLGSVAVVEDGDYLPLLLASRTTRSDQDRVDFLVNTWRPQEDTHGLVAHATLDYAEGRETSGRAERNHAAAGHITPRKKVVNWFIKHIVPAAAPDRMAAFASAKGLVNEVNPKFVYIELVGMLKNLGFSALADMYDQPPREEGVHWGKYRQDLARMLDGAGSLRRDVRFVMERHRRVVGHELLDRSEQLFLAHLFNPANAAHVRFMNWHDDKFEALPGMKGIRPFQSSLTAYRPAAFG